MIVRVYVNLLQCGFPCLAECTSLAAANCEPVFKGRKSVVCDYVECGCCDSIGYCSGVADRGRCLVAVVYGCVAEVDKGYLLRCVTGVLPALQATIGARFLAREGTLCVHTGTSHVY